MRISTLPLPTPFCPPLGIAVAALLLVLIHTAPALAATVTNTASSAVPAATAPSSLTITQTKGDDDDSGADHHSFKLNINSDHDDKPESLTAQFLDNLIPLAGIVGSFGTPIAIVFFVCYFNYRRRRENVALAREFLAKGLPVPPELLDPNQKGYGSKQGGTAQNDVRRGFRLIFIGLAVTTGLYISNPHATTWGWGLVPTIIGIGFLLSGKFEHRQDGQVPYPPDKQVPPGDGR